jgi:hypothetical protein
MTGAPEGALLITQDSIAARDGQPTNELDVYIVGRPVNCISINLDSRSDEGGLKSLSVQRERTESVFLQSDNRK